MRIFSNGTFLSCESPNRVFRVLVEDRGRIIFTGDELPVRYAGVRDRVDLNGGCAVPAFADTHIHFASFGYFQRLRQPLLPGPQTAQIPSR